MPRDVFYVFSRADNNAANIADSDTPAPLDKELINTWAVFFIERGADGGAGTIRLAATEDAVTPGDDFSFKVDVPDGIYDIVGFGNMEKSDILTIMGLTGVTEFSECKGKTVNFSDIKNRKIDITNNGFTETSDLIPMSGYREGVEIKNNYEIGNGYQYADYHKHGNRNVIELIRLAMKVSIRVKNTASKDITIKEIRMGVLNKGNVPLLPVYSILGKEGSAGEKPTIVSGDATETVVLTPTEADSGIAAGGERTFTFYGRESVANHSSGKFVVKITYDTDGITGGESSFWVPSGTIEWINRNDWIKIPITVSDLTVDWEVLFYPPIGGYPAVMTDPAATDFTFFATFATPGDFEIRATLRGADRQPVYATYAADINNAVTFPAYTFKIGEIDNEGIFTTLPHIAATGEILGTLGSTNGTATIPVTITYRQSASSEPIERTRNIAITKK